MVNLRYLSVFVLATALLQVACSKKDDAGTVRVTFPASTSTSSSSKVGSTAPASTSGKAWNSSINPAVGSDINCYAIFVGGSDLALNSFTYGQADGTVATQRFGRHMGFIPAGQSVDLSIPTGDRTFYILGLRAAVTAACSDYSNKAATVESGNLSEPFLIAAQKFTIVAGDNSVAISTAFDSSKKVYNVDFFGAGNSSVSLYGDKRDGSIASASSSPVVAGSASMSSASFTRTTVGTVSNSKIIAASRRITNIDTGGISAGRLITVGSAFTLTEFEAGDEVVWYVAGGNTAIPGSSPDTDVTGACGGKFYIGSYGTARIQSVVSGTQLLLEQTMSRDPASIRTANLSAAPSSGDYCTIVMTRVSSFDSISVASGTALNLTAQAFNYTSGTGGILMIRAAAINIGSGGSLTIDASGKGYAGGQAGGSRYQGDSVNGAGKATVGNNYGGGGAGDPSTVGGGGGGNGAPGGAGAGTNASYGFGGNLISHCTGICTPFTWMKSYFGSGGGGAGSSATGGTGGGIVILYAGSITGDGFLNIYAKGTAGGSGSVGGGSAAGGTIGVQTLMASAPMSLLASGATGGSGTFGGGGGGGGVIELVRCSATFSSSVTPSVGGGTGGPSAANGATGVYTTRDVCPAAQ